MDVLKYFLYLPVALIIIFVFVFIFINMMIDIKKHFNPAKGTVEDKINIKKDLLVYK